MKRLVNKSFKLSEDEIYYLRVLKTKYNIKVNQFVRTAIVEKLEKDVPIIRDEFRKAEQNKNIPEFAR